MKMDMSTMSVVKGDRTTVSQDVYDIIVSVASKGCPQG
jgi:hypothetical protein